MSHGATSYATLVERIRRWHLRTGEPVCFITFNYDTLLDKAAVNVLGLPLTTVESFTVHNEYKLFKLHGSVDWGQVVDAGNTNPNNPVRQIERDLITGAHGHGYTGRYQRNDVLLDFAQYAFGPFLSFDFPATTQGRLQFPAIAIPLETKTDFECPRTEVDKLVPIFRQVTKLLIIGWRGAEEHFLRLARGNLPVRVPTQVVAENNESAQQTWERLVGGANLVGDYHRATNQGFSTYLSIAELERFLG
jgi:hypothetical protein